MVSETHGSMIFIGGLQMAVFYFFQSRGESLKIFDRGRLKGENYSE
jgi:hypothetical protein